MGCRYKVAHDLLETVPNAPLASAPGKKIHPPTLRMLEMHGGQVKIDRSLISTCSKICSQFFMGDYGSVEHNPVIK